MEQATQVPSVWWESENSRSDATDTNPNTSNGSARVEYHCYGALVLFNFVATAQQYNNLLRINFTLGLS
jgi:hypothetical protein